MGLGNSDIVAAKVVSDPDPGLLPQGKGKNSSRDNGKMERGGKIQFSISVSTFAVCLAPYLLYSGGYQGAGETRCPQSFRP